MFTMYVCKCALLKNVSLLVSPLEVSLNPSSLMFLKEEACYSLFESIKKSLNVQILNYRQQANVAYGSGQN